MSFVGRFRHSGWLFKQGYGPNVYIFRNLESGQVLYTQLPFPQGYNVKKQFQRPNWENKKPTTRTDIWRVMAVAELPSYELAVECYESLVALRYERDVVQNKTSGEWRKRNKDGNVWFSGQFRPTYTQEAVADLASVLEGLQADSTVYWEDAWRRGDNSHWKDFVRHQELPRANPRERFVMLRELSTAAREAFLKARVEQNRQKQIEMSRQAALAGGSTNSTAEV